MRNLILFLCILTVTSLFAQETKLDFKKKDNTGDIKTVELTIDEAVSLALKNNLGLEGEKIKIEQKKLALYTSWNVFMPSMSFTATMSRMNDRDPIKVEGFAPATQITNPTSPGFPGYTVMPYSTEVNKPEFTPSFSFDLTSTFNFAMIFSIYNTTIDYKSGKINLESAEKKLVKDIKKNFYSFLLFEENIKLMKNKVVNSEERYKQTQTLYKNGIVPELNVLQSKVASENLKPALLELENNYEIAKISFKQTLGLKRDVNLILNGSLELPTELESFDQDELIEKYIEKRLDVQSMNLTLKTLNNVKNIGVAGLTPSFIFKFTVDPTFQYDIGDEKTWKYSTGDKKDQIMDIGDLWKQRSGMIMLGLSLPLDSWIPFSKKQTDIINADFNIKQSEVGLRQLKLGAELEIQSLVMKINKSKSMIDTLKLNLELANKVYEMCEEAYKLGSKEYLEVKEQEDQKNSAKITLLQEQYNYLTAILDLQYATNSNLKDEVKK